MHDFSFFFENDRADLEMTAHLGKGLREGSRAEPGHRRAEYAIFLKTNVFGSKRGAGCIPGVVFGRPVRFLRLFLALGSSFISFFLRGGLCLVIFNDFL